MKKLIAMVLGASMVLSLAACTSTSKQTRVTRETSRSSETTKESTDETEDTSETATENTTAESTADATKSTEESTSETSDTTSATSESETTSETTTRQDPSKPLENLECSIYYRRDGVNLLDTSGDEPDCGYVMMDCPYFTIQNPNYKDMESVIFDDVFNPRIKINQSEYEKSVEEQNKKKLAGEKLDNPDSFYKIDRFRMDSQIASFAVNDIPEITSYTYDVKTQKQLTLQDLFHTDKDFFNVIENRVKALEMGDENTKAVMDNLKSSNPVFGVTYDGIYLPDPRGLYRMDWFKISIIGMEDQVNMTYFGNTPEYYTLYFDFNKTLEWDVTGDGKIDTVKVDFALKDPDRMTGKLCIDVNGKALEFDKLDDSVSMGLNYKRAFVMHSDDGFYLYCTCSVIEGYEDTYVFKLNDGNFSYEGYIDDFFTETTYADPNNFAMYHHSFVIIPNNCEGDFSILGCHGLPGARSDFYHTYELGLITKKALVAYTVDRQLNPLEMVDLPAETSLAIVAYNPKTQQVILQTMSPSSDITGHEMYLLQVVFTDEETTIVGGSNLEDAFYGVEEIYI